MELGTEGVSDTVPIWLTIDYGKTVPYTLLKRYTLKPEAQQQGVLFVFSLCLLCVSFLKTRRHKLDCPVVALIDALITHSNLYPILIQSLSKSYQPLTNMT